eukprot:5190323-Lingulodinium_polyedra.AAC.1
MRQFWDRLGIVTAADLVDWQQQSLGERGAPRISRYERLSKETQEMVLKATGFVAQICNALREGARARRGRGRG